MFANNRYEQLTASHALQWIINLAELHAQGSLTVQTGVSFLYDDAHAFLRGEKKTWSFLENNSAITRPDLQNFPIFGTNKDMKTYVRFEIATIIEGYDRCAQGNSPLKKSATALLNSEPSANTVNGFLRKLAPETPALALGLAAEVCPLYDAITAPKISLDADRIYFMSGTDYLTIGKLKELRKRPDNRPRFNAAEEALSVFKKESKEKILRHQNRSDRKILPIMPS